MTARIHRSILVAVAATLAGLSLGCFVPCGGSGPEPSCEGAVRSAERVPTSASTARSLFRPTCVRRRHPAPTTTTRTAAPAT